MFREFNNLCFVDPTAASGATWKNIPRLAPESCEMRALQPRMTIARLYNLPGFSQDYVVRRSANPLGAPDITQAYATELVYDFDPNCHLTDGAKEKLIETIRNNRFMIMAKNLR